MIADLSRYDPPEAVDQYDGVILNVEDPGFAAKRDRAIAKNVPWGTYSWVYPGQGANASQRAHDAGVGPLGVWLDYEQEGVSPADLTAALARGDELGLKLGVYTYLYILDSVAGVIGNHPLWLAYYPGANDGSYQPAYSDDARARGALLHQFTSSGGSRDLDVVLDEARWNVWTGSTPKPTPAPLRLEDDMNIAVGPLQGRIGNVAWLLAGSLILAEWSDADGGSGFAGPKKMENWNDGTGRHYPVHLLDAAMMQALKDRKPVV